MMSFIKRTSLNDVRKNVDNLTFNGKKIGHLGKLKKIILFEFTKHRWFNIVNMGRLRRQAFAKRRLVAAATKSQSLGSLTGSASLRRSRVIPAAL